MMGWPVFFFYREFKMFGPNAVPYFNHRCKLFRSLLSNVTEGVYSQLNVPRNFDILFLTGSGTLGIEALVWSLLTDAGVTMPIRVNNEFAIRIKETLEAHEKYNPNSPNRFCVQYETACSRPQTYVGPYNFIYDCVSGFPYYDIPDNAIAFATVTGKQLGCSPGMAIVGVRNDKWRSFAHFKHHSYLNLARYREAASLWNTPNTPALSILIELHEALLKFDLVEFRKTIDQRRNKICNVVPPEFIIGEGPVVTFTNDMPTFLIDKFHLYHKPNPQVFLWCGQDDDYYELVKGLKSWTTSLP